MATQHNAYPLRLPDDLHKWIKESAKSNNRSMNAEITHQLRRSYALANVEAIPEEQDINSSVLTELRALRQQIADLENAVEDTERYEQAMRAVFRKMGG